MVNNFRFEEPGIALSAFPETAAAVDWLYDQGIRTVVSLHPVPAAAAERLRQRSIRWEPALVTDWSEGVPGSLAGVLETADRLAEEDPAVLIHCQGGGGRAGTAYAALLIQRGVPVDEAIRRVPGVQRAEQKAFLHGFAAGRASAAVTIRQLSP